MASYIIRRLLLIIPTLLCILLINFVIVQFAPGGPVEQAAARLQGLSGPASGLSSSAEGASAGAGFSLSPELLQQIKERYGFDKSPIERFGMMIRQYALFDFGESFFRGASVNDLVLQKLPVTLSIGFWSLLITYLVSIPLGIRKAVRNGTRFDVWTSWVIVTGYAMPGFLFAMLLLVFFAGGSYFNWFPVRGLVSDGFEQLSFVGKVVDYLWHLVLPVTALVTSSFAALTILTKNSFLNEIGRQYVTTARAKGLTENQVLYKHVLRNAILLVVSGVPGAMVSIFFGGALLIEVVFSLDGMGRLGYESAVARDYPVVFGLLFQFTLAGLCLKLIGDICYSLIDPRINLAARNA
ncbi:microcin C ABC transporter permease YejB [Pseudomonas putida]|uniref:microcin C ABC transporter permease YejB n=1 Tax=Pseudomonas putida TaxID=303 RepID=UPI0009A1F0F3|nr:microcin C ABC transporter permease YejB [Pseudomonas putida]